MRVVWQCCRAGGGGVLAVRTARAQRCEACSWRRAPREPRREHTNNHTTRKSYESRVSDPRGRISRSRLAGTAFSTQQPVLSRRRAHTETVSFVADTRHRVTLYREIDHRHAALSLLSPHTRVELSHEHSIVHRKVLRPQWGHIGRPIRRATDVEPGTSIEYRAH